MAARTVAVIGAGIVGTVTACFLKREGHAVTLLDRDAPGAGASFGNSGVISPAAVMPVAMPGLARKVPRWLLDETGPALSRLARASTPPALARRLRARGPGGPGAGDLGVARRPSTAPPSTCSCRSCGKPGLDAMVERKGMLYVDPAGQESAGESLAVSLQRAAGYAVETLDAGSLHDLEPALAPGFSRGFLVPAAAHTLDPHRLVTGLAGHFGRQGGTFRRARVERISAQGRDRAAIHFGGETHDYDTVVVAAGVWSRSLVAGLGYRVPLVSQRGYHATFTNPGVSLTGSSCPRPFLRPSCPWPWGIRIGGTVEFAGDGAPPNGKRADALCRHAKATLPALNVEERTTWMGERPCTPDSLPIPGPGATPPGGTLRLRPRHQGVIGASKTAEVIADLVAGQEPALDLAPFAADRFGLLSRLC